VHAGTLAKWDVAKTLSQAAEVQDALRGPNWQKALQKMYGNEPATWKEDHKGGKRMRVIINALTRIRLCTPNGHMEFATKVTP
ncbi:bis(5'-nucleosyl)-tetraphosphatase (symmetrical), partial [Burkholderia sp. SIMBA_019]